MRRQFNVVQMALHLMNQKGKKGSHGGHGVAEYVLQCLQMFTILNSVAHPAALVHRLLNPSGFVAFKMGRLDH